MQTEMSGKKIQVIKASWPLLWLFEAMYFLCANDTLNIYTCVYFVIYSVLISDWFDLERTQRCIGYLGDIGKFRYIVSIVLIELFKDYNVTAIYYMVSQWWILP